MSVKFEGKKKHSSIKMSMDTKIVIGIAYFVITLMTIVVVVPFLHVIAKAFSSDWAVYAGEVGLVPIGFNINPIIEVFSSNVYRTALFNSVYVTLVGTICAVMFSAVVAYPLASDRLPCRKGFLFFFVFTMYFNGGLIPTYLLYNQYHLLDTRFILFLPHIINIYHLLIIKNYYEGLPEAIVESAKIDGARNWIIFTRIFVPLSKPVYATIAVFTSVILWNGYLGPKMYINSSSLITIPLYLNDMIKSSQDILSQEAATTGVCMESMTSAAIIAATLPIILVYPFMQKYFIKGMTIGSTKG